MTFSRTFLAAAAAAAVALPVAAQKNGDPPPFPARPSFELAEQGRDLFIDHGPAYGFWAIAVGLDLIDGPLPPLGRGELFAFDPLFVPASGRLDATGFGWQPIDLQDRALAGQSALLQAFVIGQHGESVDSSQPIRVEFDAPKIDEPQLPPGELIAFVGADPVPWQADAAMWCACGRIPQVGVDVSVTVPTGGHALRVGEVFWYDDLATVTVTIVRPAPGAIVTEALETIDAQVPLGTRCAGLVIDLQVVQRMRDVPPPVLTPTYTSAGVGSIPR